MKNILLSAGLILFSIAAFGQYSELRYTVAKSVWKSEMGNHRAVIAVKENKEAAHVFIAWRRRDANPG